MDNDVMHRVVCINVCKACGKHLKDDWHYCPYCNTKVQMIKCWNCKATINYSWIYCPYCKTGVRDIYKNNERIEKCNEWLRDILKTDK